MVDISHGLAIGQFLRQLVEYKKDIDSALLTEKNEGTVSYYTLKCCLSVLSLVVKNLGLLIFSLTREALNNKTAIQSDRQ